MQPSVASRVTARDGFVAYVGRRTLETGRALADVRTWAPLLVVQMRRLGVDSVPIALFIAVFTGIVLSLLSSYIFTGAVPKLVRKAVRRPTALPPSRPSL